MKNIKAAGRLAILLLICVFVSGSHIEAAMDSFSRLEAAADGAIEATYSPNSPYPTFIRGNFPVHSTDRGTMEATDAADQFLDNHGPVFGITNPDKELTFASSSIDDLGMTHVTFQQIYQGIEVYHARLQVHLAANNRAVVAVGNGIIPLLSVNTITPTIEEEQALMNAMLALPGGEVTEAPALAVYPVSSDKADAAAQLVWIVDLKDDAIQVNNRYFIDAITGQIIDVVNQLTNWSLGPQDSVAQEGTNDNDDGRTLRHGTYLTGSISPETDIDTYYFVGHAGHIVAITMRENAFTSSIDPYLTLFAPDGSKLTEDNDGGPGDGAAIRRLQLTQTGTYRIEARTFNERPGLYGISMTDCAAGQFFAEYYANRDLAEDPVRYECDTLPIYYDWGREGPFSGFQADNFSVRWTGHFPFEATDYRFMVSTDDGVRLRVDNNPVIDDWNNHANTYHDALVPMTAGSHKVEIEYYEYVADAVVYAFWRKDTADDDDGKTLTSRKSEYGFLSPTGDRDSFYIYGQSGDYVRLYMKGSLFFPSLDPYIRLYDPNGVLVAEDDDSGEDNTALIGRFRLPATGRYRVEAADLGDDHEGGYHIEFTAIGLYRETYDAENTADMDHRLARKEGDGPVGDVDTDNAHNYAGETYNYFRQTHGRFSIDDQGLALLSTVHFGENFVNAQWTGTRMRYGDGFAVEDVVAHELTHGITQHTANLEYEWEPGAMNESFSDIFGAMVDREDWLMGEDLPESVLGSKNALRDLADPMRLGHPDHVDSWKVDCSTDKGVHTNSSIFNKAFYNIATSLDKGRAERIFFRALTFYLHERSSFEDGRSAAIQSAADLYGAGSNEETKVTAGFAAVGLDGSWSPPPADCDGGSCAVTAVAADRGLFPRAIDGIKLVATLYRLRDTMLDGSESGRHYRDLYETHTAAINRILLADGELRRRGGDLLQKTQPGLDALVERRGAEKVITASLANEVKSFLIDLAATAQANNELELATTISRELNYIDWNALTGMTYAEAWEYFDAHHDLFFVPLVSN